MLYLFLLLRAVALPRAGDVHRNPGPSSSPPFYNSNLNSKPDSNRGCSQGGRVRSSRGAASLSGSTLSVLQFNARSLHPKLSELADVVSHLQPDIVAITETWLTNAVPDGVLLLPDYGSIVRADRGSTGVKTSRCGGGKQRGGGVLLLIKNSINYSVRSDLQSWSESTWIEVKTCSSRSLVVGCLYLPGVIPRLC